MDPKKRALLEAALFQASRPLSIGELAQIVEMQNDELEAALEEMAAEFRADHRGMEIFEVNDKYEMRVKKAHVAHVAHLTPYADLSRGLLKVLALIIYKQPITQSDIVKTIGNRAYEYVHELEDRSLIATQKHGRTKRIEVTEQFMSYFGISSRNELLAQFKERSKEAAPVGEEIAPAIIDWMSAVVNRINDDTKIEKE